MSCDKECEKSHPWLIKVTTNSQSSGLLLKPPSTTPSWKIIQMISGKLWLIKSLRACPKITWIKGHVYIDLMSFGSDTLAPHTCDIQLPNCVHIKGGNIKAVEFLCPWLSSVMLGTLFPEELLLPSHSGLFWWFNKESSCHQTKLIQIHIFLWCIPGLELNFFKSNKQKKRENNYHLCV